MPNFFSPALLIVSVNVPEGKIAEIFQVKLHFPGFGRKKGEEEERQEIVAEKAWEVFLHDDDDKCRSKWPLYHGGRVVAVELCKGDER